MKRSIVVLVTVVTLVALLVSASVAVAAKPDKSLQNNGEVVWNNGFPSGPHLTLNIHGKKFEFKDCETCTIITGECLGGSVFVPEYTVENYPAQIHYVMNKHSNLNYLCVRDPCSFPWSGNEDDPAIVQLPKGEYQVYARVLGKPGKPGIIVGEGRRVAFYPRLIDACNSGTIPEEEFSEYWSCDEEALIGLGVATSQGAFTLEEGNLERIAPMKGKNKAVPFSDMFYWTGYVFDEMYDIDGDGAVEQEDLEQYFAGIGNASLPDLNSDGFVNLDDIDLALDYDVIDGADVTACDDAGYYPLLDLDSNSVLDLADLQAYQAVIDVYATATGNSNIPDFNGDGYVNEGDVDLVDDNMITEADFDEYVTLYGKYLEDKWIFDIADMVIYGWDYENYGSKLVQVRFYPKDATNFVE